MLATRLNVDSHLDFFCFSSFVLWVLLIEQGCFDTTCTMAGQKDSMCGYGYITRRFLGGSTAALGRLYVNLQSWARLSVSTQMQFTFQGVLFTSDDIRV
jgi:hypothetical protein